MKNSSTNSPKISKDFINLKFLEEISEIEE